MPDPVSLGEARRLALRAQGFGTPRPGKPGPRHLAALIRRLGLLQIDFVNVLVPSHYLVPFSRLGPYNRAALDLVVYGGREFTEQWAHEASIIPVETWPLLRHRRDTHIARPWGFDDIMAEHKEYVETAVAEITRRGPLGPSDMPDPSHTGRRLPESWYGSVPRAVLEACFGRGQLAVTARRENFSRVFDLADRVIPHEHYHRQLDRHEAERELLRIAARACGIGTAADLADYFRMKVGEARPRIMELLEAGDLQEAQVEGWRETAYIPRPSWSGRRSRSRRARRRCLRAALAVRSAHLVPPADKAALRLRLPLRDLRAGGEAEVGKLRAAVPHGRAAGRARGPEVGPPEQASARARGVPGAGG